jgi:glycosidase
MNLHDPAVDAVLAANPATTTTSSGKTIPYPFSSPQDWRDHWIYFLLVDRFNNPLKPPTPDAYPCNSYQGGNFAGIVQQLPYLKQLGAGAIWISPVLMNPQWFTDYWGGYGIMDFTRVEPRFCKDPGAALNDPSIADSEFRELVDEAHALGIHVILDIVLNHTGDLFNYEGMMDAAPWNNNGEYRIFWRNDSGVPQEEETVIENVPQMPATAGVWPKEMQHNAYFRKRGDVAGSPDIREGDFGRMKELVTELVDTEEGTFPVRNNLIRAYQYLIAKFDLDGYRIDTLQYIEPEFARSFGNAMREYAMSIGKKNFFTFGEVWQDDDESKIASFVGRNTQQSGDFIGVDAAIDFPMRRRLWNVCKGFAPPSVLAEHYDQRRSALKTVVSSHGDAGDFYIKFLDNHDVNERFHNPEFPGQTKIALACMMALQGITCIYYGCEQGLSGSGDRREFVRQAMWGNQDAFSTNSEFYTYIQQLSGLYNAQPAIRYGRQYFRETSKNGTDFGYSNETGDVVAFSRILNTKEIVVIANTNAEQESNVEVVVDNHLHADGQPWKILFPAERENDEPVITTTKGKLRTVQVHLPAMGCVILG